MKAQLTNRDYEQLSAYIDGQLAPGERRKLEERLHVRPELQAALDDLSRTRALLRQAPRRRAPRNFTLTPAMVGNQGPRRRQGISWNLFPALSFASALAAFALVVSFVFQLLPGQQNLTTGGALPQAQSQSQADQSRNAAQKAAAPAGSTAATQPAAALAAPQAPAAAESAPAGSAQKSSGLASPIINWGQSQAAAQPAYGMGGGGGGGQGPSVGALLGPPAAQGSPLGMGGGASGVIVLPPQTAPSANDTASAGAAQPQVQAQPSAKIQGTGPILGVPEKQQGGQIVEEKAILGQPAAQEAAGAGAAQPEQQPTLLGLPQLLALQILLAVIAVATGVTAFVLRRRA